MHKDKTFTISAAANVSTSYYIVRISTYGHCEDGGSRQFAVSQRIEATEFNNGQFITALLKGNFVDKEWVENHPSAIKGTLAGNDIYTLDGVVYYLMDADDCSFGGHVGGISSIDVSAYNADNKPIATASLAK